MLRTGVNDAGQNDAAVVPDETDEPADAPHGTIKSFVVATQRISVRLKVVRAVPYIFVVGYTPNHPPLPSYEYASVRPVLIPADAPVAYHTPFK
jgi:hypothetical protein